jgi:hypothetical protein
MIHEYNAILEIKGDYRGRDGQRLLDVLNHLRKSTIEGKQIEIIHHYDPSEPCRVSHFRYSYLCKDVCPHELEPYGVNRYFGINLFVDGELSDIGMILKPTSDSELTICGHIVPYDGERTDLTRANAELKIAS